MNSVCRLTSTTKDPSKFRSMKNLARKVFASLQIMIELAISVTLNAILFHSAYASVYVPYISYFGLVVEPAAFLIDKDDGCCSCFGMQ